jgi:hypothetical protein
VNNLPAPQSQQPVRRLRHTTPEQRASVYEDVRDLLSPGFLSESVTVNGTRLALRSVSRADHFLLKYRAGSTDYTEPEVQFWFLASAVWMVGGQSVLEDPQATPTVYEALRALPVSALSELLFVQARLSDRFNDAMGRMRGFNFEDESRFLWRAYGENILTGSGIPGAERLGLNPFHRMWIAFNKADDEREQFQVGWMQTKLIAASQSPKGVKKLNASDQQAQEREKARRQAIMDAVFYASQGHDIDLQDVSKRGRYAGIKTAVTPEELEDEMQRWRAGVKDDHDVVVDFYKRRISDRVEAERAEQRNRVIAAQRAIEAEGYTEPSLQPLVMQADEIRRRFRAGTSKVYYSPKANSLYERYLAHEAEPGQIVMRGGQPVSVPEGDAVSLQEQVQKRRRAMRGGR